MAESRDLTVQPIDLGPLGINAGDPLAMVIGQPLFEVTAADSIKILPAYRQANLDVITHAFRIRAAEMPGRGTTPFVVFPEFAIPVEEPDGLDCVRREIEQAAGELVFISGMEWMTPQQLAGLARRYSATAPTMGQGEFVNCCVVAVKDGSGHVSWHFQAKLFPAAQEQRRSMARGAVVYYFHAAHCGFVIQICFDQIAASGLNDLGPSLLRKIADLPAPATKRLDYVFVPQYNNAPHDRSFKDTTAAILSTRHSGLSSEGLAVVAINRASPSQDVLTFGHSGFHYLDRWQVPQDDSTNGYALFKSGHVTSAVFRKHTAAIHVTGLVPPIANTGRTGNPRSPLEGPRSYISQGVATICDTPACAGVPRDNPPTGRYVSCGALPCILRTHLAANLPASDPTTARWHAAAAHFVTSLVTAYGELRERLFALPRDKAEAVIDVLFCQRSCGRGNPDMWEDDDRQALLEWVSALSVLQTTGALALAPSAWLTADLGEHCAFAIADGADTRYMVTVEAYLKRFEDALWEAPSRQRQVVLAVLRSRGHMSPLISKFRDFTEPKTTDLEPPGDERPYSSPIRISMFICKDLFDEVRGATDPAGKLKDAMGKLHG